MSAPLVSVIIPVFNAEKYVRDAVGSALRQSYQPLEIIAVDDGSTDHSLEVLKSFGSRIQLISQKNGGLAVARNRGIKLAKGDFYAFLDADDIWPVEKIRNQMAHIESDPLVDAVSGYVQEFFSEEMGDDKKRKLRCNLESIPLFSAGTSLFRREAFHKVGWFDQRWEVGVDMDWILRAKEKNIKVFILPEVVLKRRIHDSNKGILKKDFIHQRAQILKEHLDRKRGILKG